jgi:hypothetical protein
MNNESELSVVEVAQAINHTSNCLEFKTKFKFDDGSAFLTIKQGDTPHQVAGKLDDAAEYIRRKARGAVQ